MNRILIIVCLFFLFSCKQQETPKGIINKDQMVNVLFDMGITDAYLGQVFKPDSLLREAHTRYNYIFKKNNIDSAKFTRSLKYYSLNAKELKEIYAKVTDSLNNLQKDRRKKMIKKTKLIKRKKVFKNDIPSK
ncbi:DUF4296 domain-containing protein [Pedobacter sp. SD-b]|uniref:DUF4296 domain-containing protein n=1 Tax=Pedobacter segetis TaxID=2793069 RepID=A0ABS1BNL5_9SPHI|nr:DUF4296 domain-containing protein [Pedobacter segetis]MBK0384398.1 DUF4296 domain-containing protein [Pedobacter segetis]